MALAAPMARPITVAGAVSHCPEKTASYRTNGHFRAEFIVDCELSLAQIDGAESFDGAE
jgi:hypothetical protein